MEDELTVHVTSSNIERIILQALTDALVMFAMLTAFQTYAFLVMRFSMVWKKFHFNKTCHITLHVL